MSFLTRRRKIDPVWVYRTQGMVWRVVSAGSSMFVGEDRNAEKKRVSFFGLNRISGKVLWEHVSFDEPWWISIEATHGDRVFLHGYARPDMPDHWKIHALDLPTGQVAWSKEDMRFMAAAGDSVFASKDSATGRTVFELRLETGETLRSWDNDSREVTAARSREQADTHGLPEFPVPVNEMDPADQRAGLVRKLSEGKNIVAAEVLLHGDFCLHSYHERSDSRGALRNMLQVVHLPTGKQVFVETLGENLQTVAPDTFFVQDGLLYFVRDRSVLTAVRLSAFSQV